ncbi:hypothetical protein KM1_122740 [Entamoeba histolytica HM-3:IMSS]|uniref:Uncharacterized protein n=2 Tax=Entamoeba histolytica TaxID=5759 RepID=M7WT00_ENTHI|nr:hypothetical protein KM1_122740 [Entamoeba histolytica HM-3:IMSS]
MQQQTNSATFFEGILNSLQLSNCDKLQTLIRLNNSLTSIETISPPSFILLTKLLEWLQRSLERRLPSTQYVIITYSLIFKLIRLLLNDKSIQKPNISALIRACVESMSHYSVLSLNISLFSHSLQLISKLIRFYPQLFNLFYSSFRDLCIQPYIGRFTPIQLENVSILVEFHVSKIVEIAIEHNATASIPMLYPVTSLFNVHSEPPPSNCRVVKKIVDRYPGIERLSGDQLAEILINIIERPVPDFPYRYNMPPIMMSHFYSIWTAFINKMEEGMKEEEDRENDRFQDKEKEVVTNRLISMEEIKLEEQEEVEVVNTNLIDLQRDDTLVTVVEFATDSVVRLCHSYEQSCHPDEKRLCEKVVSDILLMLIKEVDLETIRLEDKTLVDYLIYFTTKDNCKNIKLIIFLMFELYLRKYNELYLAIFKKVLFELIHPPQPGLITFFNQIPLIPRDIEEIDNILSLLRIEKHMEEEETNNSLQNNQINEQNKKEEESPKKEEKKIEIIISDNEENNEIVKKVVDFTIRIIKQTPQSYIVLLPLLTKHLYCYPIDLQINVITRICTEIYPFIPGGFRNGIVPILKLICESNEYEYTMAIVRLLYAMCLYQNDLLIEIIKQLQDIIVTDTFIDAFFGNLTSLLKPLVYIIFEEQNFIQYVHFISTNDNKLNQYKITLLENICDFYLPSLPEHQCSVRVQTLVNVILSYFLKEPMKYSQFVVSILPVLNPPYFKQIFSWLISNLESQPKYIEIIFDRIISSRASRYKFEDIIINLIDSKTSHLVEYVELLCSVVKNHPNTSLRTKINFMQSMDILISKKTDTSTCLLCLVNIIKLSTGIKYITLIDKLLRVIKTSEITDTILPVFVELIELTIPSGIHLLMLLSEERIRGVMNEHPKIVQIIRELPRQDYDKLDKTVRKVIESLIKPN